MAEGQLDNKKELKDWMDSIKCDVCLRDFVDKDKVADIVPEFIPEELKGKVKTICKECDRNVAILRKEEADTFAIKVTKEILLKMTNYFKAEEVRTKAAKKKGSNGGAES